MSSALQMQPSLPSMWGLRAPERKAVMASLFKRRKQYWVNYYLDGVQVRKSLRTTNERVARAKLKQIEYELAIGDLHVASRLPLPVILETFCRHLMATRTYKSYKNDFSRLRVIFGPICEALKIRPPGSPSSRRARPQPDKYAGKHIQWNLLKAIQANYFGITADELAARAECSKRQVQRDLNVLQLVGFPIRYEVRDYGKRFWRMESHFLESEKLALTEVLCQVRLAWR